MESIQLDYSVDRGFADAGAGGDFSIRDGLFFLDQLKDSVNIFVVVDDTWLCPVGSRVAGALNDELRSSPPLDGAKRQRKAFFGQGFPCLFTSGPHGVTG